MKEQNKINTVFWIFNVIFLAFGVCALIIDGLHIAVYVYVICTIAIFYGVAKIINFLFDDYRNTIFKNCFAIGLLTISFGVYSMLNVQRTIEILPYILCFITCYNLFLKWQNTIDLVRCKSNVWWLMILVGITLISTIYFNYTYIESIQQISVKFLATSCTVNALANITAGIFLNYAASKINAKSQTINNAVQKPLHETQEFELVEIKKIQNDTIKLPPIDGGELDVPTEGVIRPTEGELSGDNRTVKQEENDKLKQQAIQDEQNEKLAEKLALDKAKNEIAKQEEKKDTTQEQNEQALQDNKQEQEQSENLNEQ